MSTRQAVVSIGTNSTRALLADMTPSRPRVELALSVGTRIGEGLGERGRLGDEPMRRTLEVVRAHFQALRGHYVKLYAITTSAVRRAENAGEFAAQIESILGVPLRILSGDEEAAASYRGAITSLEMKSGEHVGVIDTGGGSTEYAAGDDHHPERTVSCEIGAVRLTERVPVLAGRDGTIAQSVVDEARDVAREALAPILDFGDVSKVACVGGSATTTAAVVRAKDSITVVELTREELQRALNRLLDMTWEERKTVTGMKPQRADILPGGIIVLDTALEMLGHDRATVTTSDLLLGYLLQQRDASPLTRAGAPRLSSGRYG